MVFTEILENFIKLLEKIPENLKATAYTLLFFLSTIEIVLTIYTNIDNEGFNYIKWGKVKILKIGFIMFAINKYEWLLNGVKSFFLEIGTKGLGVSLGTNDYFNDPSKIWDRGREIAKLIWNEIGIRPSTYVFILIGGFVIVGFFMISIQIIICWVEFYFLTGISLIFLPFGALEMTGEYYKNVFKTIMGASIKLCVFNIWLIACDKILNSLFTAKTSYKLDDTLVICGTVYILVTIMLSMPSMTTSLLTGTPTLNAGSAMSGAMAAGVGTVTGAYHAARGTFEAGKGAWEGAKAGSGIGGKIGGAVGSMGVAGSMGGEAGIKAGSIGGKIIGAGIGAIAGGSYAGARYLSTKQESKPKEEKSKQKKESNKTESTSSSNTTSSNTDDSHSQSNDTGTAQNNSTSTNSSSTGNTGTTNNSSENINTGTEEGGKGNVKNRLPEWAKRDY